LNWAVRIRSELANGTTCDPAPVFNTSPHRFAAAGTFTGSGGSSESVLARGSAAGSRYVVDGLSPVPGQAGEFETTLTSPNSQGYPSRVEAIVVTDAALDFDGNGRFNEGDLAVVSAAIGQPWPNDLATYDEDEDGVVDTSEVDAIERFIALGLGAGIFGDLNSNGVVNCLDFGLVPSGAFSAELGDAAYRIQLDQNLDGEVTSAEQLEFYKRVQHPDFNLGGFVDFFDYDAFTANFQTGGC
jgi:hypothetical protein